MSNLNPQGVGIIGPTSQMRKLKVWSLIIQVWWSLGHGWETPGLGTAGSCSRFPQQTWFRAEPSGCPWTDRSSRFTDEETEMWRLECLFRITQEVQNRDKFGIQLSWFLVRCAYHHIDPNIYRSLPNYRSKCIYTFYPFYTAPGKETRGP